MQNIFLDVHGAKSIFLGRFIPSIKEIVPFIAGSVNFWNTKMQDLGFAKVPGSNWLSNAHHVKVWRTSFSLNSENIIYVGLVNANFGFKWGIIPKIAPDLNMERELLYLDLERTGGIESHLVAQLVKPLIGKNFIRDQFFSDGKVYIIAVR